MNEAVTDNDILIKLARYDLLATLAEDLFSSAPLGVLAQARFVVKDRLRRDYSQQNQADLLARFDDFLGTAEEIEISEAELTLATALEDAALEARVSVDTGESQLFSVAILRSISYVITGDKRAISGLCKLADKVQQSQLLKGRIVCLEQIAMWALAVLGTEQTRERVCREPGSDKALSSCFSCSRLTQPGNLAVVEGLTSYMRDLRNSAPGYLSGEQES